MPGSRSQSPGARGFTLFEALLAMAVFALAFMGLAAALDAGIGAGIAARDSERVRRELENRLAFCMASPPKPGEKRVIEAKDNRGVRVQESLEAYEAKNMDNEPLAGLWTLKIVVEEPGGMQGEADTLLYIP